MGTYLQFTPFSSLDLVGVALLSVVIYCFSLAIHRLYLSPLSAYPGPKLAGLTLWYEFYYDVIKRGKFAWEIKRMHEVYGPIVRINPFEIHISDPDFYDELYTGGSRKRNKHEWSADMFGIPEAMLSTVAHDLHRQRRAPIAPFFSQQAIRRFDPVIRKKLSILVSRLEEYERTEQPVDLEAAFTALTTDIISEYAFGISYGHLEADSFNPDWLKLLMGASENSHLEKQMPWLTKLMRKVPMSLLLKIKPQMGHFVVFQDGIANTLREVMTGTTKPTADSSHATIFHSLLASDLPTTDLTPQRLVGEGQTIVAAGTLTTAHYLKTTMYYLLINPKILSRLRNELEEAIPNAADLPPFKNLDLLTYLNAVINEGFRISHGIIQRLTRIAPDEVLTYKSYTIPAGTPIGMSSWDMHLSPTIFPSPHTFNPDRWLESGAEQKRKFLVNFTKGSRMCLGKDLARTEILYTICTLVRRWGMDGEMSLYKTGQEDVDIAHDFFNPFAKIESKGVRVVLKGVRT